MQRATVVCLLTIALLSSACFKSETVVTRVPKGQENLESLDGVPYRLPRTVIKVDVPVKKTTESPGQYAKFTRCFFPKEVFPDDPTLETEIKFSIEDPGFGYRIEPDPDQGFIVSVKGGYFAKKSLILDYSPGAIITKGQAEASDESLDFALKTLKTAVSIGAAVSGISPAAALPTFEAIARMNNEARLDKFNRLTDAQQCYATLKRNAEDEKTKADKAANQVGATAADQDEAAKAKKRLDQATEELAIVSNTVDATEKQMQEPVRNEVEPSQLQLKRSAVKRSKRGTRLRRPLKRRSVAVTSVAEHQTSNDLVVEKGQPAKTAGELIGEYEDAKARADEIKALQDKRNELVSGQTASESLDPETLKLMLKETDDTIDKYKSLFFFGSTVEKIWRGSFEFTPKDTEIVSQPLFLFSEQAGLCPTSLSVRQGVKIPSKFKITEIAKCPAKDDTDVKYEAVWLSVENFTRAGNGNFEEKLKNVQEHLEDKQKKRGWYYRIPASATVKLVKNKLTLSEMQQLADALDHNTETQFKLANGRELARKLTDVAQLGITVSAPASGAGRTNQSTIVLDETGALKNFSYASDPLLKQTMLDDVEATSKTLTDAKKARLEAEDPLTKMKRDLDALKTQNQINEEKKKLTNSNSNSNNP